MISNSDDPAGDRMMQVVLSSFYVVLEPTPTQITNQDSLVKVIQDTIAQYVRLQTPELDYLYLADVASLDWSPGGRRQMRRTSSQPFSTLLFMEGVASFTGDQGYTPHQVNQWASEAIANDLPSTLANYPDFSSIQQAHYISNTPVRRVWLLEDGIAVSCIP